MPDNEAFAGRAHVVAGAVFTLVWTTIFLFTGLCLSARLSIGWILAGGVLAAGAAMIGMVPGERYFLVRSPERLIKLSRRGGIVLLKAWMLHGDRMNAAIRRRAPGYRVIRLNADALNIYMSRTRDMERIHLGCLLASLVICALTLFGGFGVMAGLILAITLISNVLPIVIQRFNRARCQLALKRRYAFRPQQTPRTIRNLGPQD